MIAWLRARVEWVWFGIAAGVLFLVALFLGRRQKRPTSAPLEAQINHGLGVADRIEEERAAKAEEVTEIDREIARVTVASEGKSAAEVAADFNARRRK